MKCFRSFIFIISLFFQQTAWSLEGGSASFEEFRQGTSAYSVAVDMAHNPNVTKNTSFTDLRYIRELRKAEMPYGASERYAQAHMMNGSANFHWAAAKTDPRSPGFLINSMDTLVADPNADMRINDAINQSELSAAQAGDNAQKYIASQIIKPNTGYYQTADNQQAFESAYDNVLLGRAEEALFESDQSNAIAYYDSQKAAFQSSSDKQLEAGDYQKNALMRAKDTAETFSDFFSLKGSVSQNNLAKMPTTGSLVGGCQQNSPRGEDLFSVYNYVMPRDEIEFYQFSPPSYSFDFCEQYVMNNGSYLIQNQATHGKLGEIITDSAQMVAGLNDISQRLSNEALTVPEITKILNSNPAWNSLGERSKAWKECAKTNCLDAYENAIEGVVTYPGYEKYLDQDTLQVRRDVRQISETGRMISSLSGGAKAFGQAAMGLTTSVNFGNGSDGVGLNGANGKDIVNGKPNNHKGIGLTEGALENSAFAAKLGQNNVFYKVGKNSAGSISTGIYQRDENGVLRGPSGKPIQGYESKAEENLFKIISRRYLTKIMNEDF